MGEAPQLDKLQFVDDTKDQKEITADDANKILGKLEDIKNRQAVVDQCGKGFDTVDKKSKDTITKWCEDAIKSEKFNDFDFAPKEKTQERSAKIGVLYLYASIKLNNKNPNMDFLKQSYNVLKFKAENNEGMKQIENKTITEQMPKAVPVKIETTKIDNIFNAPKQVVVERQIGDNQIVKTTELDKEWNKINVKKIKQDDESLKEKEKNKDITFRATPDKTKIFVPVSPEEIVDILNTSEKKDEEINSPLGINKMPGDKFDKKIVIPNVEQNKLFKNYDIKVDLLWRINIDLKKDPNANWLEKGEFETVLANLLDKWHIANIDMRNYSLKWEKKDWKVLVDKLVFRVWENSKQEVTSPDLEKMEQIKKTWTWEIISNWMPWREYSKTPNWEMYAKQIDKNKTVLQYQKFDKTENKWIHDVADPYINATNEKVNDNIV